MGWWIIGFKSKNSWLIPHLGHLRKRLRCQFNWARNSQNYEEWTLFDKLQRTEKQSIKSAKHVDFSAIVKGQDSMLRACLAYGLHANVFEKGKKSI